VFGLPFVHHVQNHLRPVSIMQRGGGRATYLAGMGQEPAVVDTTGVPVIVDAPDENGDEAAPVPGATLDPAAPWGGNNGLFRTHGEGGGIFNQVLSGLGELNSGSLLTFAAGAAAGYGLYWYLTKKKRGV
jgi:hypothetical protein